MLEKIALSADQFAGAGSFAGSGSPGEIADPRRGLVKNGVRHLFAADPFGLASAGSERLTITPDSHTMLCRAVAKSL